MPLISFSCIKYVIHRCITCMTHHHHLHDSCKLYHLKASSLSTLVRCSFTSCMSARKGCQADSIAPNLLKHLTCPQYVGGHGMVRGDYYGTACRCLPQAYLIMFMREPGRQLGTCQLMQWFWGID